MSKQAGGGVALAGAAGMIGGLFLAACPRRARVAAE
jgi:hypothetical protein